MWRKIRNIAEGRKKTSYSSKFTRYIGEFVCYIGGFVWYILANLSGIFPIQAVVRKEYLILIRICLNFLLIFLLLFLLLIFLLAKDKEKRLDQPLCPSEAYSTSLQESCSSHHLIAASLINQGWMSNMKGQNIVSSQETVWRGWEKQTAALCVAFL